jgi:hypothetical protein
MKIGRVLVLYKNKGERNLLSNYRPITVLCYFSKIIEKCLYDQLYAYFEDNSLLTGAQFGFRKNRSAEIALLSVKEYVLDSFNSGRFVLGVCIDFQKAFDSIKHNVLCDKLLCYGVTNKSTRLIENYLSNRKQFVRLETSSSTTSTIRAGVPQGSILGPLLFLIYINVIANVSLRWKAVIFADDSNYFLNCNSAQEAESEGNELILELQEWARTNGLVIHDQKTQAIVFKPKNRHITVSLYSPSGSAVQVCDHLKILGVTFTADMSWNQHVDCLVNKLSSINGAVYRVRSILPTNIKNFLYYSLFYSHLYYCLLVYGTMSKTCIEKILKQQKKFIRNIVNAPRLAPTEQLFSTLHILRVDKLYSFKLARALHSSNKSHHLYRELSQIQYVPVSKYALRHQNNFQIPKTTREYSRQSLKYRAPELLNSFPVNILNSECSLASAKSLIKQLVGNS